MRSGKDDAFRQGLQIYVNSKKSCRSAKVFFVSKGQATYACHYIPYRQIIIMWQSYISHVIHEACRCLQRSVDKTDNGTRMHENIMWKYAINLFVMFLRSCYIERWEITLLLNCLLLFFIHLILIQFLTLNDENYLYLWKMHISIITIWSISMPIYRK